MTVWYIVQESRVYHTTPECAALKTRWRYGPLREASGTKADYIIGKRRRCKRCPA